MLDDIDPRVRDLIVAARRFSRLQMPRIDSGDGTMLRPNEVFLLMCIRHARHAASRTHSNGDAHTVAASGLRPSELAARMGVTAGSVTQILTTLEERALLHRDRDEVDRRLVHVRLTTKGIQAMDNAMRTMGVAFEGLAGVLGEEESAHFTRLLEKANEYFGPLFGTCHGTSHGAVHGPHGPVHENSPGRGLAVQGAKE